MTKDVARSRLPESYELKIPESVMRDLDQLPQRSAGAAVNFIQRELRHRPDQAGLRLEGSLEGVLSAKGTGFRILYRVGRADRVVCILRIEPR
ncbi:type II toxin-antitoxin system RelE/ParE family toxin [Streptomyces sp. NPDC101175]|uniref:type II toxin-antitoxin system RelE family toxin n=1 Tax=Streptomyces sp. NPDC101175 TaxID=3366123 RepID=UPI0038362744